MLWMKQAVMLSLYRILLFSIKGQPSLGIYAKLKNIFTSLPHTSQVEWVLGRWNVEQ